MNMFRGAALCFLILLFITAGVFAGNKPPKMQRPPPPPRPPPRRTPTEVWCVAKTFASSKKLKEFIDGACKQGLDCRAIAEGQDCNFRNDIRKQASYVLNLYFVRHNTCMTQYGTLTHKNPSSGRCKFPLVNLNG